MLGVSYPKDMGMNHKIINAFDIPTYKMTPHFEDAYQFIKNALQKGNVLVHCAAGISRVKNIINLVDNFCSGIFDALKRIYIRARNRICSKQKTYNKSKLWFPKLAFQI